MSSSALPALEAFLSWPPVAVSRALSFEHPQTIAAVLVRAAPDARAAVLSLFTERLRNDVLLRLAASESVLPMGSRLIEAAAEAWLAAPDVWLSEPAFAFGVQSAVDACARLPGDQREAALNAIREYDPELEESIGPASRRLCSDIERSEIEEAMPAAARSEPTKSL